MRDEYPVTRSTVLAESMGRSLLAIYRMAGKLELRKSPGYMSEVNGPILRVVGAAHRFKPGQQVWNKGKPGSTGMHPASRRNHYQPGTVNGRAAEIVQPVGSLRVTKDGLLQRKIGTQSGPSNLRWRSVHELVWIEANGPIPPGHVAVFLPGMHTNVEADITLERIELVSRAELMRRNSVHRYGIEISRLAQLKGAIQRQINRRTRAAEENAK